MTEDKPFDQMEHFLMRDSIFCLCMVLALLFGPECLRSSDNLTARIDSILHETYAGDEPGATVIVTQNGETLYRGAIGMANVKDFMRC